MSRYAPLAAKAVSSAPETALASAVHEEALEAVKKPLMPKAATPEMMPRIATTTNSSTSVKPESPPRLARMFPSAPPRHDHTPLEFGGTVLPRTQRVAECATLCHCGRG